MYLRKRRKVRTNEGLKARLHIHGSDHGSLRFVTVSKIVENSDEPWSESSFLRMPTNNHGAATISYDLSTVFLRVHAGVCRLWPRSVTVYYGGSTVGDGATTVWYGTSTVPHGGPTVDHDAITVWHGRCRYLCGYWRTCHGWLRSSTKGRRSRTFQLRVWIIFYICITAYIVKYGERSACSERTKEIHVVSALYSNDTPIQDCDHLSMTG